MGTAKVKSGSKEGKVQYPYDAMVYIDGTVIRAIDKDGNTIRRGVAGTDDSVVIQAAIDTPSVNSLLITEGDFVLDNAISPKDDMIIELQGCLKIIDTISDPLASDVAIGSSIIVVTDGSKFRAGQWIAITDDSKGTHNGRKNGAAGQIISIVGNTITIDRNLTAGYSVIQNGVVATCHSAIRIAEKDNIYIFGEGEIDGNYANQTLIYAALPVGAYPLGSECDAFSGISVRYSSNIKVKDLYIHDFVHHGLCYDYVADFEITSVKSHGSNDKQILLYSYDISHSCCNGSIDKCIAGGSLYEDGISIYKLVGLTTVSNCIIHDNPRYGIFISNDSYQCTIYNNKVRDNLTGIQLGASGQNVNKIDVISNNVYENRCGIYCRNLTNGKLIGNLISGQGTGSHSTPFGMYLWSGTGCIISNNTIVESYQVGLAFNTSTDCMVNNNYISSNSQMADDTYANVILWGAFTNCTFYNNMIRAGSLTNKPKYGLYIDTNTNNILFIENDLRSSGKTSNVYNLSTYQSNIFVGNSGYIHISELRDALDNILDKLGTPRLLCPCAEITGTSITDYTRNSNTLTAQASVATWYGFQGRATYYDFDGAAKYLYRANDTDFDFGNSAVDQAFSIVACVYADNVASRQIIGKWDANNAREWRFFLDASGYPTIQLYDESIDKYIGRQDQTALVTTGWKVLIATYDGSGICGGCKIYLDGIQVDDADYTDAGYVAMEAVTANLMVGALKNAAVYSEYWDGKMTWNAVAAKELSAEEAWSLTQRLKGVLGI